jgi:hypothetical protein
MGFALGLLGTHGVGPAYAGLGVVLAHISNFGTIRPENSDLRGPLGSQMPNRSGVRMASLETEVGFESAAEESDPPASKRPRASFDERFLVDQRFASFDERFLVDQRLASFDERFGAAVREKNVLLPPPDAIAHPPVGRSAPKLASVTSSPPVADVAKKRIRTADLSKDSGSGSGADSRTAIYDIADHTVYLPNGRRLEAHSGLGSLMDDARYVNVKRDT